MVTITYYSWLITMVIPITNTLNHLVTVTTKDRHLLVQSCHICGSPDGKFGLPPTVVWCLMDENLMGEFMWGLI